jgi:hypothetical protein
LPQYSRFKEGDILPKSLATQELDMAPISSPTPDLKPVFRRDESAGHLAGPLAFSIAGLLTHGLALAMQGEPALVLLRAYLIMGAAPIAALVALRFAAKACQHAS